MFICISLLLSYFFWIESMKSMIGLYILDFARSVFLRTLSFLNSTIQLNSKIKYDLSIKLQKKKLQWSTSALDNLFKNKLHKILKCNRETCKKRLHFFKVSLLRVSSRKLNSFLILLLKYHSHNSFDFNVTMWCKM